MNFKNFKTKKSLGQNFLKSEQALRKIIEAGEVKPNDVILEIGPGKGALTEKLLEKAGQVIAIEKDRELVEFLKEKFKNEISEKKLILIEDDILNFEIPKSLCYKIVANIPYNITGAILKKFLSAKGGQPERMVLLVQHEVAQRIVARDGKESILSISVKAYGEPKLVMKVPARYFSPAPKVDSAVIKITNISRKIFSAKGGSASGGQDACIKEEKFWEIVKMGFAHKRKVLKSNLKNVIPSEILSTLGNKRAENLRIFEWLELAR